MAQTFNIKNDIIMLEDEETYHLIVCAFSLKTNVLLDICTILPKNLSLFNYKIDNCFNFYKITASNTIKLYLPAFDVIKKYLQACVARIIETGN